MRAHGVPNFPDPGSGPLTGEAEQVPLAAGGRELARFKHAVQVCGGGGRIHVRGGNVGAP